MATKISVKRISQSSEANAILLKLRALRDEIPGFQIPTSGVSPSNLFARAGIPAKFIEAASVAVESSPVLKAASAMDTDQAREAVAFAAAYEAVADEADAFSRAIRHTIAVKKAAVGKDALQAYDLAKGLARKPEGAVLVPHIQEMKKSLGRTGRKRATTPTTPQSPRRDAGSESVFGARASIIISSASRSPVPEEFSLPPRLFTPVAGIGTTLQRDRDPTSGVVPPREHL